MRRHSIYTQRSPVRNTPSGSNGVAECFLKIVNGEALLFAGEFPLDSLDERTRMSAFKHQLNTTDELRLLTCNHDSLVILDSHSNKLTFSNSQSPEPLI